MPERDPKRLYFDVPSENIVTILNYELVKNGDWTENKYTIKENIETEYDYFIAGEGLHNKIKALNVSAGDTIVIKKQIVEGYADGNPFFKIEMAQNPVVKAIPVIEESPVGAGFAQKDDKMNLHELTARVEALENKVAKLELPF